MGKDIQLDDLDFEDALHALKGADNHFLDEEAAAKQEITSESIALTEFDYRIHQLTGVVGAYKALLQQDIAALEEAKNILQEADEEIGQSIQGGGM